MDTDLLHFNGINGATGEYDLPPMTAEAIASVVLGETLDDETRTLLKNRYDNQGESFGVNADTRDLAQTGWGVIFAAKDEQAPAIRDALQPLLDLRREQASRADERCYKEFAGAQGYYPDDSHLDFLGREPRFKGAGPATPHQVPYYLLIIGDPEMISFRFQYQLDVQYAVGRLYFDSLEEYAQYAQSVVEAEQARVRLPRKAVFFGVQNPHDPATQLSADMLIKPLVQAMASAQPGWELQTCLGEQASKANLAAFLGGTETPALLFTASHGMGFPNGDARQLAHQGALLCADWPGPREWRKPIPEDFYFSADDVGSEARLLGGLAFFFACYGAGTPHMDDFAKKVLSERAALAPHAFLARLPRRMLGHPKGGALALIGHVERAWDYSFRWKEAGPQLQVFQDTLDQLMAGYPVGAAMEWFNERHAEFSVVLATESERVKDGILARDDTKLARIWTANNDARNYTIVGDPAVRLPVVEANQAPVERPVIQISRPLMAQPTQPAPAGEVEYGLFDSGGMRELTESLQQLARKLGDSLKLLVENTGSLDVATYVSDDIDTAEYKDGKFTGARLRARTHIKFDGDTQACVPVDDEGIDEALWKIHVDMVERAQANRAEMFKTAVSAVTGLFGMVKPQ